MADCPYQHDHRFRSVDRVGRLDEPAAGGRSHQNQIIRSRSSNAALSYFMKDRHFFQASVGSIALHFRQARGDWGSRGVEGMLSEVEY